MVRRAGGETSGRSTPTPSRSVGWSPAILGWSFSRTRIFNWSGSVVLKDEDIKTDAPLVVRMERAGSVKGRLVDDDGLPLCGGQARGHDL